jgi:glycosyltransferase involved in cell wall biosynthesis
MKILIVNYRYFVSGGPERYMFNLTEGLTSRGHEVIPFSIRYSANDPTPYAQYFVEPLGSPDEVTFAEQCLTAGTVWRTMQRLFYASDVERAVRRIVSETRPQIAYVLHYLRKLSPSLLVGLKRAGVPVVVRLSDYGMLCAEQHCLRGGVACELCVLGNLWPSIRYGCVQNSRTASALNALATCYHRWRRYFDLIDVFVTTTQIMHRMMLAAGFPERRLRCVPTYVDGTTFRPSTGFEKSPYLAYAGALRAIKGVHVLVDALAILRRTRPDLPLCAKIAGAGDPGYSAHLERKVREAGLQDVVELVGELNATALATLLNKALVAVVPSVCYENLPNAVLESYACGTPVIASDHGALRECVVNGETGYRFPPGDAAGLAGQLEHCLGHPQEVLAMAKNARRVAETVYSPAHHLDALERLLDEILGTKPRPTARPDRVVGAAR